MRTSESVRKTHTSAGIGARRDSDLTAVERNNNKIRKK